MYIEDKEYEKINAIRVLIKISIVNSRAEIAEKLNLGEGVTRRILDLLKSKGFIISTNKGHKYTENGKLLIKKIKKNLYLTKNITTKLYPGYKNTAILVKDYNKTKLDYKLRDVAIRNGAQSAIIFCCKNKNLKLPDCSYDSEEFKKIQKNFILTENDVLIITFAKEQVVSDISCLFAAYEVSSCLKVF